ncbi:MAG: hypothetical protein V3V99_13150 [candidate division Zixibacteria bacterium]
MTAEELKDLLKKIDELEKVFIKCRALFPSMHESCIGKTRIQTAVHYRQKLGQNVFIDFGRKIKQADRDDFSRIGHYLNENVLFRLASILEYHRICFGSIDIDHETDGWEAVDLIRRIRNVIGHTLGEYDSNKPKHRIIIDRINSISGENHDPDKIIAFPLSIDTVVDKTFDGCIKYIKAKYDTKP